VRGGAKAMIVATLFGAVSGLGGFLISAMTDLPASR
jgi:ABC-type Mn2+/Zn2+ transport system permease subunit